MYTISNAFCVLFQALELKDEEVDELKGIRERLMKEVSDFTASLFEVCNYIVKVLFNFIFIYIGIFLDY